MIHEQNAVSLNGILSFLIPTSDLSTKISTTEVQGLTNNPTLIMEGNNPSDFWGTLLGTIPQIFESQAAADLRKFQLEHQAIEGRTRLSIQAEKSKMTMYLSIALIFGAILYGTFKR